MGAMVELTREEKDELFEQYSAAMDRGDYDAAWEVGKKLPIHPKLVKWVRKVFTPAQIKEYELIMPDSLE